MKGFTLIETIIYIALLGLIMTGALLTAYALIDSGSYGSGKNTMVDEGSFVIRKIAWALTGMSATPVVGGSGCSQTLSVTKAGHGDNPIEFRRSAANDTIEMRQGGAGAYAPLTTGNVSATCLRFKLFSEAPAGLSATTTVNGFDFGTTKYIRI